MNEVTKEALNFLGISIGLVSLFSIAEKNTLMFWATGLGSLFFCIETIIYGTKSIKSAFH